MSFSAPPSKVPTPSGTPRASISDDEHRGGGDRGDRIPSRAGSVTLGLPRALKPVGLVNQGMTCFLNSTMQALVATPALIALLAPNPSAPLHPSPTSLLPAPALSPALIPALQPESLEPPLYELLPVTRAFLASIHKAWTMKDSGGGTSGSGEAARSMALRSLLREMARKYDQYDEFRQQDSHELLRHLLDSMEMEEKDVIKRLQPSAGHHQHRSNSRPRKGLDNDLAAISPLLSPVDTQPSSPSRLLSADPFGTLGHEETLTATPESKSSLDSTRSGSTTRGEIPDNEQLVPFVDVLFGGLFASVVVCESCKSVSHTYEGFLDISLSLKADTPPVRKRDKFRAMASRLKPRPGSNKPIAGDHTGAVMSDPEASDTERGGRSRRESFDDDVRSDVGAGAGAGTAVSGTQLSRNSSAKSLGLKSKPSFSFRRKATRTTSSGSTASVSAATATASADPSNQSSSTSLPTSPTVSAHHHHVHVHQAGPTQAQLAYIQRILYGPPGAPETTDPLAKLRAAHASGLDSVSPSTPGKGDYGLIDSLKAFTSVEVLEGENAFACKKCWKIKSGHYNRHSSSSGAGAGHLSSPSAVPEEDESTDTFSPLSQSLSFESTSTLARVNAPSISINGSDTDLPSSGYIGAGASTSSENSRLGRFASASSSRSLVRAPSPLRHAVEPQTLSAVDSSLRSVVESVAAGKAPVDGDQSDATTDGLSNSDTSDDEDVPASRLSHLLRPKLTHRKSKHFVHRRAFKRYLIAKAPEVLVFHIKRFKQTQKTGIAFSNFYNLKKMDDFVSFPEQLDLAPFLAPNRADYKLVHTSNGLHAPYMDWPSPEQGPELEPVLYRLYSIVVHLGTMVGGHYVAYCLVDPEKMFGPEPGAQGPDSNTDANTPGETHGGDTEANVRGATTKLAALGVDGKKKDRRVWCYCSDTSIRLASLDEVLSARAYLCFYEKVEN